MSIRGKLLAAIAATSAMALSSCAGPYAHRTDWYGSGRASVPYDYHGHDYAYGSVPPGPAYFQGAGAAVLDPWLAFTAEGRGIVSEGFTTSDGWISAETAHRANVWFRRYADSNGDMALTDPEIRIALVQASLTAGGPRY